MSNTTTLNEVLRSPVDGSEFVRLATPGANWKAPISAFARNLAASNITFFVSPTGNDNNDGLTPGTAFATPQHALLVAENYDYRFGFFPTINVADGTYNLPTRVLFPDLRNLSTNGVFIGNVLTPANCIFNFTGNPEHGIYGPFTSQTGWSVKGFQLQGAQDLIRVETTAQLHIDDIIFVTNNSSTAACISANGPCAVLLGQDHFILTVTGNGGNFFINASVDAQIIDLGIGINFTSLVTWNSAFLAASFACYLGIGYGPITNPGNIHGKQYEINNGGALDYGSASDRSGVPGTTVGEIFFNGIFEEDPFGQIVIPTSGGTVNATPGCHNLILNPAAGLATLTVNLPAYMTDIESIRISTSQTITSLTIAANATFGSTPTIVGAPTTLAAGSAFEMFFDAVNKVWYIN